MQHFKSRLENLDIMILQQWLSMYNLFHVLDPVYPVKLNLN